MSNNVDHIFIEIVGDKILVKRNFDIISQGTVLTNNQSAAGVISITHITIEQESMFED